MIKGKKTGQDDGNYTKIPNNILKARNLSGNAVRALGLMIDRQSALENAGKLREDDLFYMVASAFNDAMDISGTQVQRTIIPELERKGLITRCPCPKDADSVYRRYTFYSLNWDMIYSYDGSRKDEVKEAKKKAKGRKAQEVLRSRQASATVEDKATGVTDAAGVDRRVLRVLAEKLRYLSVEDMLRLDWDCPQQPEEQKAFFTEMYEKFALHRLGYIHMDYDEAFNKLVGLFSQCDRCSEGIARVKLEYRIHKVEEALSGVIKSLQAV